MLYSLPSNVIPFFLIAVAGLFFGIRGLISYRRVHSPLTLYYATSGVLIGLSNLFYSVPFIFTQEEAMLKASILIGDLFFYLVIMVQLKIIWYLTLANRVKFIWLALPVAALAIASTLSSIISLPNIDYYVVNNKAHFPASTLTSRLAALLSVILVVQGAITIIKALSVEDKKARIRMFIIGITFGFGGVIAVYNFLSSAGNTTGSITIYGYSLLAIILIAGILVLSRKKGTQGPK